ncbi:MULTISPECIES: hypothetical protein [unclassified Streptomyces]|uniref:hypothetical protein n=1 Tax=unclassified Streptomyces TaxID=2593676 RepID=UPI000DB915F4|nr:MULTISPECIES: hypothetical protein [unclassified Streptomyces]MYT70888.1 hypothetical protein [Streptomyces sp. SID8367]RAJ90596.1 hypothetical protein K377_01222 [Streptomyces sp. PsTaAH-137]
MGTIDHDAVLRARVLLLGTGRLALLQEVNAYRVLAEVSPKAYLPKFVDALLLMSYRTRDAEVRLLLTREAIEAVRKIEAGMPRRDERVRSALDAHQRALFGVGRRDEGRAVCEELARKGQSEPLARVLTEEGRFGEAAALNEAAGRGGDPAEQPFWRLVPWAANLEGAGQHAEATAAFLGLVDWTRRQATERRSALAALAWEAVHLSRMYETAGRGPQAAAARHEALAVLADLAADGGPGSGAGDLSQWSTLFVLSGRSGEPAASADAPLFPFGTDVNRVSATRGAFLGALPELEARAQALEEAGRLPELSDVRRRIGVRAVLRQAGHFHLFEERLAPHFDEGVALARRLPRDPGRLARALTDRSVFRTAIRAFGPAHADFAEAVAVLGAR